MDIDYTRICGAAAILSGNIHVNDSAREIKYRINYTQEWVMCLCNPRVCDYPKVKPRDKCKQVGYSA